MKDTLMSILTILGMVIGSGFMSGKEIVVFFSRFGLISFVGIFISFILFYFLFKFMLSSGDWAFKKLSSSKMSFLINILLCLFFSSAMFAGISNILTFDHKIISFLIFFAVIFACFLVYKFGIGSLNKINLFLVPFMIIVLLVTLFSKISFSKLPTLQSSQPIFSIFYAFLYVILNTSNGGILIAKLGENLSKRQKTQVAFVSALTLSVILLIANWVLLQNPNYFDNAMPLIVMYSFIMKTLMTIVTLIGCLTTLLTLVYTLSSSIRGLCKNEFIIFFISVILPLVISLLGFNFIVEQLYPIASMLGVFLLVDLFFIPFFKRQNKKIHSTSKHA